MKLKLLFAFTAVGCHLMGVSGQGSDEEPAAELVSQACTTLKEQARATEASFQIDNERDVLASLFTILDLQDSIKKINNSVAMWKSYTTMTSRNIQEVEAYIKKSDEEINTLEMKVVLEKQGLLKCVGNDVNKLREYLIRMEDPNLFKRAMSLSLGLDSNNHLMQSSLGRFSILDKLAILQMRIIRLKDEESLKHNAFIEAELKYMTSSEGEYTKLFKKRKEELEEYMVLKNKLETAMKNLQTSNDVVYLVKKLKLLRIFTVLGDPVDIKEEMDRSKKEIEREDKRLHEKLAEVEVLKELRQDVESTLAVVKQQQHLRRRIEIVSGRTQGADELDKFTCFFRERLQTHLHNDINKLVDEIEKLLIEVIREAIQKKEMIIDEIRSNMFQEISTVEQLLSNETQISVENTPDIETKFVDSVIKRAEDYKKSLEGSKKSNDATIASPGLHPTLEATSLISEVKRLIMTVLVTKIESKERQLKQVACRLHTPYRRLRQFIGK